MDYLVHFFQPFSQIKGYLWVRIRLKGHPTILLSHHKSKQAIRDKGEGQADARGSSGLTDGVRWQGNLNKGKSPEFSVLEVTKTNFTAYPTKIVMKKGKDGVPEFEEWEENQLSSRSTEIKKKKQADPDETDAFYDLSKFKKYT